MMHRRAQSRDALPARPSDAAQTVPTARRARTYLTTATISLIGVRGPDEFAAVIAKLAGIDSIAKLFAGAWQSRRYRQVQHINQRRAKVTPDRVRLTADLHVLPMRGCGRALQRRNPAITPPGRDSRSNAARPSLLGVQHAATNPGSEGFRAARPCLGL
jgi:hypothetical protein